MSDPLACPPNAPVELSDGKIIMPDDQITLADLCELMPLLLETLSISAKSGNGRVTPGGQVPIAGQTSYGTPAIPANMNPFGTSGPVMTGGSGGFGGGGGSKGARGPAGPVGPAGPGQIVPVIKTDGNFTVASVSPFVVIPGTTKIFKAGSAGPALFFVQAVFGGNSVSGKTNGQVGLRVDGVDYPLTANLIHTGAVGVGQFLVSAQASFPINLSAGDHTAELIVRGDSTLGAPTGSPVVVQANASIPLALTIIHK
jgi:hypothetical protein